MNQALGNVGATVTYGPSSKPRRPTRRRRLRDLVDGMDAGQVELLVILGGNPVYTAPADLQVRGAAAEGRRSRLPRPLRRRDGGPLPLAHAGGAPPRERGATRAPRRHRHDHPAADRAALRRTLGARSARRARRRSPARSQLRHREGLLDARVRRAGRLDDSATPRASRSPSADQFWQHALHDGFIRARRSQTGDRPRHSCRRPRRLRGTRDRGAAAAPGIAGRSPAAPAQPAPAADHRHRQQSCEHRRHRRRARDHLPARSRRSGTAASPTTAGCRSCPKPLTKLTWDTDGVGQPALAEQHKPATTATSSSCVIAATPRGCRSSVVARPSRRQSVTVFFGYGRTHGGPRRQRRRRWREQFNAVPAPHVRRAVVRQRPRDREDRRPLPARARRRNTT